MKLKTGWFEIRVSIFFIAVIPVVVFTRSYYQFAIAFLSIIIHELAHMAAAAFFHCRTVSVRILPLGLSADIDMGGCSRNRRLVIYSCGPLMSFFLSAVSCLAYVLYPESKSYLGYISFLNFYLAIFNLIPAIPLDGGRILLEILNGGVGLIKAARYVRFTALFLSITAAVAGIYRILTGSVNLSLFLMGLYFIIFFNSGKMEASLMNIKQLLNRRQRLLKKGVYQARDIVVLKGMRLGAVIKSMDYDSFHFIYLMDEDLNLLRIITENEIVQCMLKHPGDMTFEELLTYLKQE